MIDFDRLNHNIFLIVRSYFVFTASCLITTCCASIIGCCIEQRYDQILYSVIAGCVYYGFFLLFGVAPINTIILYMLDIFRINCSIINNWKLILLEGAIYTILLIPILYYFNDFSYTLFLLPYAIIIPIIIIGRIIRR